MPAEVNKALGKKLGDLALETLNRIHKIVGDDAMEKDYVKEGNISVDNYMFNESMCIMQFIEFMIADYKYNMREAVEKLESRRGVLGVFTSSDLGRDFFEPR
jgi:hypothetical protein